MTDTPLNPPPFREDQRTLLQVAKQIGLAGTFVEVGTFKGEFAFYIMHDAGPQKLYCVDPYATYDAFKDAMNQMDLEQIYAEARARLSPFGERVEFLRTFSQDAARQFTDETLDLCYIDGNHAYEFVMQDIQAWYPKVRRGGLLCGDDATDVEDDSARDAAGNVRRVWTVDAAGQPQSWGDYGVLKAVRAFAAAHQLQFFMTGSQWVIMKGGTFRPS